ncbi:LNS2-domain-containing protein [Coprinopsis marcescibilis]|uniref:phosphatidate phosphatase n=1 Tax=Coprinopsis marcescibilis TaxID=230819 RepID=A0A5C3KRC1_COPMA|nr:LNS2-domain-containing protein [Coprinopsis marcescibilis]
MNYIRGVASAISAPYQYYKELPPINPSTLTGAIDVIVIERLGPDGETELACSPFHVRFGKWQVLRPSEKKVNVSVNGNPIPFSMKIGEAGEAFFVFETEGDVPEDLITSPIIQPTEPEVVPETPTDRFGARRDDDESDEQRRSEADEARLRQEEVGSQEPEYLDLNDQVDGSVQLNGKARLEEDDRVTTTPKQANHVPSFLKRSDSRATINQQSSLSEASKRRRTSPSRERTPEMDYQDRRVDEALKVLSGEAHLPEVEYHHDVALDIEGYHSGYHNRERSGQTIRSSEFSLPPSSIPTGVTPSISISEDEPSPPASPASDGASQPETVPFPMLRATSEPPPDVMDEIEANSTQILSGSSTETTQNTQPQRLQIQEYSWEWGGFPQPSPMKATFSKSGRLEGPVYGTPANSHRRAKTLQIRNGRLGGMQLPVMQDSDEEEDDGEPITHRGRSLAEKEHGRSHSVPAAVPDSPTRRKHRERRRRWKEYEDFDEEDADVYDVKVEEVGIDESPSKNAEFGLGGTLHANKRDPTKFILSIEGRRVGFELSVFPDETLERDSTQDTGEYSGEAIRQFFKKEDPVHTAQVFQKGLVDFNTFLEDSSIVSAPPLVIRWIGIDQYVTRQDGSPLMDALVHWREAALQRRTFGPSSRPMSPASEEESRPTSPSNDEVERGAPGIQEEQGSKPIHLRAKSEPIEDIPGPETAPPGIKPTSSSWTQWWSRSRRTTNVDIHPQNGSAAPATEDMKQEHLPSVNPPTERSEEQELKVEVTPTEPGPSIQEPHRPAEPIRNIKYAKTLRLTSDQLKSLDLKPGANTITFSLSTTGAVAATARIFVWDYTDAVVVSDIDGTITKSDGLGHVFAMIGRDWTHLGVAKLYTDITRNGYKIMYLTSRAIGQADATRGYLKGIKQNNYQLPEGPVIMSPDRLMASLHREVIMRKPEVFKMACLRDIQRLFGEHSKYPFYAGFGNRITDALSYRSVNIPSARIFTIDSAGEVKMELLELAGYKSSYIHMTDLVDQMFPPIHRKWTPEFTDFNYWRAPVQEFPLPDLSPPSPALSARSDTSNQSTLARLRNFSLAGGRQATMKPDVGSLLEEEDGERDNQLRQMSSFERLSTTLGFMSTVNSIRRSVSPDPYSSDDEDEENHGRARRERRRSITSMPGSLHEEDMDFDEDEEEDHDEYDGEHDPEVAPEEHAEEAFDDDLLAAGEMQKVPFL